LYSISNVHEKLLRMYPWTKYPTENQNKNHRTTRTQDKQVNTTQKTSNQTKQPQKEIHKEIQKKNH